MASLVTMKTEVLVQKGNILKINLAITNEKISNSPLMTTVSPVYVIGGSTRFQVRVTASYTSNDGLRNMVYIQSSKNCRDDDLTYSIMFTSSIFGITNKRFSSDDDTWQLVHENENLLQYNCDVAIQLVTVPSASCFSVLHDDIKFTDFELRGVDGSVRFHKAVLAASSPVFETMLTGTWRETTKGYANVPGTSKKALQHFKNYMYLRSLPDEDLKQLAILSSYYMMPELAQGCADRLVDSLTNENVCELLEFAGKHNVTRLVLAILDCVKNSAIDLEETRGHLLRGEHAALSADNKMIKHKNNDEEAQLVKSECKGKLEETSEDD